MDEDLVSEHPRDVVRRVAPLPPIEIAVRKVQSRSARVEIDNARRSREHFRCDRVTKALGEPSVWSPRPQAVHVAAVPPEAVDPRAPRAHFEGNGIRNRYENEVAGECFGVQGTQELFQHTDLNDLV